MASPSSQTRSSHLDESPVQTQSAPTLPGARCAWVPRTSSIGLRMTPSFDLQMMNWTDSRSGGLHTSTVHARAVERTRRAYRLCLCSCFSHRSHCMRCCCYAHVLRVTPQGRQQLTVELDPPGLRTAVKVGPSLRCTPRHLPRTLPMRRCGSLKVMLTGEPAASEHAPCLSEQADQSCSKPAAQSPLRQRALCRPRIGQTFARAAESAAAVLTQMLRQEKTSWNLQRKAAVVCRHAPRKFWMAAKSAPLLAWKSLQ
mmetsp:Transcript_59705/g.109746  ORF Transcript_59705/g.109746 Transcript_59705/m.109746 type:complete len:256 (+) Transcript_59705:185-952(+)